MIESLTEPVSTQYLLQQQKCNALLLKNIMKLVSTFTPSNSLSFTYQQIVLYVIPGPYM